MFVPKKALATSNFRFVYAQSKKGVWVPYIQYDIIRTGVPWHVDISAWDNAQLDGKIELLDYLQKEANDRYIL